MLSVLTAYAGYIVAEELDVSGVSARSSLAFTRLVRAHRPRLRDRLSAIAFWRVMVLGLEAMLFILLGLEAPQVADELEVAPLVWQAVVVAIRSSWADGLRDRPAGGFGACGASGRGRLGRHVWRVSLVAAP